MNYSITHKRNGLPRVRNHRGNYYGFSVWQWFAHLLAVAMIAGLFI